MQVIKKLCNFVVFSTPPIYESISLFFSVEAEDEDTGGTNK